MQHSPIALQPGKRPCGALAEGRFILLGPSLPPDPLTPRRRSTLGPFLAQRSEKQIPSSDIRISLIHTKNPPL